MSITKTTLPVQLRDQLAPRREFGAMCVSSWREAAAAALESVSESFAAFEAAAGPEERSYRAWEAVASAVEMAEMFATALINRRAPRSYAFHSATNADVRGVFEELNSLGFSFTEARDFLRLRHPNVAGARGRAVTRAWMKLVESVQEAGNFVSAYWCSHIESTRWFRHFPGSFTVEEALRIDISPNAQRDDVLRQIRSTPDLVDVVCHLDGNRFSYTGLTRQEIVAARAVARLTAELVVGWLVNVGLDRTMKPRERIVFPHLHAKLSEDQREILRRYGYDLSA